MKRLLTVIIVITFILTGCAAPADNGRLQVCTSFYAMYDLARMIGGDKISIKNLVPDGSEPHDKELSVSSMISLDNADIFIYNGLGLEDFAERVINSGRDELLCVEASEGCRILYGYEDEDHEHGNEDHEHEDITNADPHVWLDPFNAAKEAENICEAFCLKDPSNGDYYRGNLEDFKKKAAELDLAYKNGLANLRKREIIVSHGAYGYICNAYNLKQKAVEGMGSHSEPSPARVRKIYDFIRENNIDCIFYESLTGSRTAMAISEDLGISLYPITAYEGISPEQKKQGLDYFGIMYNNLESLKKGLE